MNRLFLSAVVAASTLFSAFSYSAPVLQINGSGKLAGATGVDVNGTLYDVTFVDGTCINIFTGCDSASDFAFNTQTDALAAADALLTQIFLDGPSGNFDAQPELTSGCTSESACSALTPYMLGTTLGRFVAFSGRASNRPAEVSDSVGVANTFRPDFDSTLGGEFDNFVYAVWSPAAVPLPAGSWLFLSAVGGLIAFRHKKYTNHQ